MLEIGVVALNKSLQVESAGAAHADSIVELFSRCDAPCFCQYFQFPGDNRDWQLRCGEDREANARALRQQLSDGQLQGFVGTIEDEVVGWLRLERPELLTKRYQGRLYRGLPCFEGERARVMSVVCFLVDPKLRGQGVARSLLEAALGWGRAEGLSSLEAFPRGAEDVTEEEQWTGPVGLYTGLGFVRVHEFSPYPVFRFDF